MITTIRDISPSEKLFLLFVSLFGSNGQAKLRRFVKFGIQGEEILRELSGENAPMAEIVEKLVDEYKRRGLDDFFERLRHTFQFRSDDIDRVAHVWPTPELGTGTPIAYLLLYRSGDRISHYRVKTDRITLGRGTESLIRLDDELISRMHARLDFSHTHAQEHITIWLTDLKSSNGTLVRGDRIVPNQPYRLEFGQQFTMGSFTVSVNSSKPKDPPLITPRTVKG